MAVARLAIKDTVTQILHLWRRDERTFYDESDVQIELSRVIHDGHDVIS